jgi:hypothetical protein
MPSIVNLCAAKLLNAPAGNGALDLISSVVDMRLSPSTLVAALDQQERGSDILINAGTERIPIWKPKVEVR